MTGDRLNWPSSLWVDTAAPGPRFAPLDGEHACEIAVVGAGFTGLSAALHLAQSGRDVCVLEAAQPGWGASGRNGGQVNPGMKLLPDRIEAVYGRERGTRINAMANEACDLVFHLIESHDMDCDPVRPGYVQGADSRRGVAFLESWARQWTARGAPVELLSHRETSQLIGTGAYLRGLLDRRGGNIQPLAYARGLARAAGKAGARIQGDSPALSIARTGEAWKLTTPAGSLTAPHVLLCTNGYTDRLWPGLAKAVVPVPSFVAATAPLDVQRLGAILPGRHAVSETRRIQVYYRMDAHGRFVIGGRGNLFNDAQMGNPSRVHAEARRLFPALEGVSWQYHWGGYTAMTLSHAPKLMTLGPGLHAGMGYNGRGVAMATMMGKQLAAVVVGDQPLMPPEPLSRIPFHGLRQLGLSYRLMAGGLLDAWEHLAERRTGMRLLED